MGDVVSLMEQISSFSLIPSLCDVLGHNSNIYVYCHLLVKEEKKKRSCFPANTFRGHFQSDKDLKQVIMCIRGNVNVILWVNPRLCSDKSVHDIFT